MCCNHGSSIITIGSVTHRMTSEHRLNGVSHLNNLNRVGEGNFVTLILNSPVTIDNEGRTAAINNLIAVADCQCCGIRAVVAKIGRHTSRSREGVHLAESIKIENRVVRTGIGRTSGVLYVNHVFHFLTGLTATVCHAIGSDNLNGARTRNHFGVVHRKSIHIGAVVGNGEASSLKFGDSIQRVGSVGSVGIRDGATVNVEGVKRHASERGFHRISNGEGDGISRHTHGIVRNFEDNFENGVAADMRLNLNIVESIGHNIHVRMGLSNHVIECPLKFVVGSAAFHRSIETVGMEARAGISRSRSLN